MELSLSNQQKQTLSLKQSLSVHILQLGLAELCTLAEKESMENPMIDLDNVPLPPTPATSYLPRRRSVSFDGDEGDMLEELNGIEDSQDLIDYLFSQIKLSALSQREKTNAIKVSGFVEKSGYINTAIEDISTLCGITCLEVYTAIAFIQTLEPVGVGARSLSECLKLQLDKNDDIARLIVRDYLTHVSQNKVSSIAKHLKVDLILVENAIARIKALNPRPGLSYEKSETPVFIIPDLTVTISGDDVLVVLNKEASFDIKISSTYQRLLLDCQDTATIEYVKEKLESAKWLKQAVENRAETILLVTKAVVRHQQDFFKSKEGQLIPLKLKDIAKEISMHESTVSRSIKDKFIQSPRGILPLKQLFSTGLTANDGSSTSASHIKTRIKELISAEDKSKPLSDQKISEFLYAEGIACSRRTVVKYRQSLNIPSTNLR